MLCHREKQSRRETRLINILQVRDKRPNGVAAATHTEPANSPRLLTRVRPLCAPQFVSTTCWKSLFGKAADALERGVDNEDECKRQPALVGAPLL
jgi:hypothetical protein